MKIKNPPRILLAVAAVFTFVSIAAAGDRVDVVVVRNERESLRGTWELTSAVESGKRLHGTNRIRIEPETWVADRKEFVYELDTLPTPRRIDWRCDGKIWKGIYQIEGDELTLCIVPPGEPRPMRFVSTPGDKRQLHTRHRVRRPDAADGT